MSVVAQYLGKNRYVILPLKLRVFSTEVCKICLKIHTKAWKMMPRHRGRLIEAFGTFPAAAPRDPCITQALEEEVLLREHP